MLPLHLLISPATAPKYPMSQRHRQYGFSLLELVVVMGILAIFASVSLTFVGEKDVQQRYNESLEKLTMVKRNFLSVDKFQGQMVMHGFYSDNGKINDGIEDDGMNDDDRIAECIKDVGEEAKSKCILKVSVSTSLKIILDKKFQHEQYMPFSFIDSIPVNDAVFSYVDGDGDVVLENITIGGTIIGAGLYKGIRPGAYDLSQYQDANSEIRDAWGDEFKLNSEFDTNTIQIGIENEGYKYLDESKSKVDISYSDLVVNVNFNLTLKIDKEKVPQSGEFRFAVVSFDNSTTCKPIPESCWTTQLSGISQPTSLPTTFALNEKPLTPNSVSFDNTTDLITSISNQSTEGKKITELVFNDKGKKEWSLTTQPFIASAKFNGNLTVGSHVVALLEKSGTDWVLYGSTSGSHTFEYLHIFPGQQTPNPITMSIP